MRRIRITNPLRFGVACFLAGMLSVFMMTAAVQWLLNSYDGDAETISKSEWEQIINQ